MNCEAKGIPKPDYYWYKDGQKIFDDDNRSPMVGLENALNFQGSLLLQKVAWKDRNCFIHKKSLCVLTFGAESGGQNMGFEIRLFITILFIYRRNKRPFKVGNW